MTVNWIDSYNTGDPLHDMAVVEALLGQAEAGSLQLLKGMIQDVSDKVKEINHISELLRNHRGTDQTSPANLGADAAEILTAMKVFCPTVDTGVLANGQLPAGALDSWESALSSANTEQTSESSQDQSDVTSMMGKYNGAEDAASGGLKKRETIADSVAGNTHA